MKRRFRVDETPWTPASNTERAAGAAPVDVFSAVDRSPTPRGARGFITSPPMVGRHLGIDRAGFCHRTLDSTDTARIELQRRPGVGDRDGRRRLPVTPPGPTAGAPAGRRPAAATCEGATPKDRHAVGERPNRGHRRVSQKPRGAPRYLRADDGRPGSSSSRNPSQRRRRRSAGSDIQRGFRARSGSRLPAARHLRVAPPGLRQRRPPDLRLDRRFVGWTALVLFAVGCGETRFIDPDEGLKASLGFATVERLRIEDDPRLYLHIRLTTRSIPDDLRFSILGPWGRAQFPVAEASRQPCGRGQTCFAWSGPPSPGEPVTEIALTVPSLALERRAPLVEVRLPAHGVIGQPRANNGEVLVNVVDPIREHFGLAELVERQEGDRVIREGTALLFARTFDARVTPGACADTNRGSWTTLDSVPGIIDGAFDESPIPTACLAVRPSLPPGGPAVGERSLTARAVLTDYEHVYSPAVEVAPIVFVPLFDLEIPDVARCQTAQDLVRATLISVATEIATQPSAPTEVLALAPESIAVVDGVPCRQNNQRTFSAQGLAERVNRAIDEAFGPDRRVRVTWVYANNLFLPLPPALDAALIALREEFAALDRRDDFMIALATAPATDQIAVNVRLDWVATEEPTFRTAIEDLMTAVWPFRSVIHTEQTTVSLLSEDQPSPPLFYRICDANRPDVEPVQPLLTGLNVRPAAPDVPAYRVPLPPVILASPGEFTLPSVVVEWQACEALCDQPAPDRQDPTPWWSLPACL